MNYTTILEKKRDGLRLNSREIDFCIDEIARGHVPDYQVSALLMAIYIQGMTPQETARLTRAMTHSGEIIDLSDIPGPKIDKHSTGGVGDKVSIVLAPLAAAAGINVPMISGRSLGHTGGTLDKLESIPGFRTDLSIEEFKTNIKDLGLCLIGQTKDVAPADKIMYSLRDATATVSSVPLITSSIMSKKLAEGINGLVLDVKIGNGSFLPDMDKAEQLTQSLIDTAMLNDLKVTAMLTDMDQPLGDCAGNWVEIVESVNTLQGKGPQDLTELTLAQAAHMMLMAEKAETFDQAKETLTGLLNNGKAYEKFLQIVERQYGDISVFENPEELYQPAQKISILAQESGIISSMQTRDIGYILVDLGGGRRHVHDKIDPAAAIWFHRKKGEAVIAGDTLMTVYTNRPVKDLEKKLLETVTISEEFNLDNHLIYKTIKP